jgi:hypothetical protein
MAAQETYRAVQNGQEHMFPRRDGSQPVKLHFTIGPFRNGVDLWVVNQENGIANRL